MREIIGFFSFVALILLALFLVWFGLKSYGLSKPISTYETKLVANLKNQVQSGALFWGDSQPLLNVQFDDQSWVDSKTKEDLAKLLSNHPIQNPTLVFFSGKDPKALPSLRQLVKQNDQWKNIIFCSRFDGLLKDLRELEPEWSFCNGEIYMTRFLAFNSLGLESLQQIEADVFFIHYVTSISKKEINQIIKEARRQNKLVFIGPVTRPLDGLEPDGWMVISEDQKVE